MVRFTINEQPFFRCGFHRDFSDKPKIIFSSLAMIWLLRIPPRLIVRLCRLRKMLVPSNCWQMLVWVPVECIHLTFLTRLSKLCHRSMNLRISSASLSTPSIGWRMQYTIMLFKNTEWLPSVIIRVARSLEKFSRIFCRFVNIEILLHTFFRMLLDMWYSTVFQQTCLITMGTFYHKTEMEQIYVLFFWITLFNFDSM